MEFRILGPLEVLDNGRAVGLGGAKQRALFALLLLARGRPVSSEHLIEEIWEGAPPESAHKSVHVYVSGLRKALGDERIVTRERGYALVLEPGELDVDRFERLVGEASGVPPATAAVALRGALDLFRGAPLDDFALERWAQPEIARIEERRLLAVEKRVDADLELGRHRDVVSELETLVAEHPYREHLLGQLMTALYRSGRQADALEAYRRGAGSLRNELGLEPSRVLLELEHRLLRQDPSLDRDEPAAARIARARRGWRLVTIGGAAIAIAAIAAAAVVLEHRGSVTLRHLDPGIAILDSRTGRLVSTVSTTTVSQPVEAQTGAGRLWVLSLSPFLFTRIDPTTGKILQRIDSPLGGDVGGYLPDGASVWFTGIHDLVRVDVRTGLEADRKTLVPATHGFGLVGIARGAGSLWIASNEENQLLRVNPGTLRIMRRIPMPIPWAVAFGEGAVWVTSNTAGVLRIDPTTNTVTATAPVPPPVTNLAIGGGFAWATNETKGTLYKIDQHGNIVTTYKTGDGARDVSFANGTLWVVNQDNGTVTGVDATTGSERVLRFGHTLNSMTALGGRLLVVINPERTYEDQVAALTGAVARLIVPIYQFDSPDPAVAQNPFAFQVERATCASLLRYPDSAPPAGFRLQPELAATLPAVSSDGRTYTFTVRGGYRFAPPSNNPVTASSVRYAIERALSPKLGDSPPGTAYLSDIQGAAAYQAGERSHVSGIRVTGPRISVTLLAPSADFLERLSLPYFCPVPLDTPIVRDGLRDLAPATAGPYTMTRFLNGEYMILTRNPNYHGPRPHALDAIAFREGIDDETAVGRVEKGAWDGVSLYGSSAILDPTGAVARRWGPGSAAARRHDERYHATSLRHVGYLMLNAGRPLFGSARIRRAVSRALDRSALAQPFAFTASSQLLPPGVRGYRPARLTPPTKTFTPVVPAGTLATMAVPSGCQPCRQVAAVVTSSLAPLGITVQTREVDDPHSAVRSQPQAFDLIDSASEIAYPDPASMLQQMLLRDLPRSWLPPSVIAPVEALERLRGTARDAAALRLARRFETDVVPVIAYGYPTIGSFDAPRLRCRVWTENESGLDLASLCLRTS
jgi:DNA-binding SARP family transcriptional activator/ABC-type oligopeptide transport system substrate-binding subunit/streptogramin lyase